MFAPSYDLTVGNTTMPVKLEEDKKSGTLKFSSEPNNDVQIKLELGENPFKFGARGEFNIDKTGSLDCPFDRGTLTATFTRCPSGTTVSKIIFNVRDAFKGESEVPSAASVTSNYQWTLAIAEGS